MNRLPSRTRQGRRDIIVIILLVVPLVAIGYYLAAIEVAVDPPPDPADAATPTVTSTPRPTAIDPPLADGSSSPAATPATPVASPVAARATTDARASFTSPVADGADPPWVGSLRETAARS